MKTRVCPKNLVNDCRNSEPLRSPSLGNENIELKNIRLSKRRTPTISGQILFPQWCPLIRESTVYHLISKNHFSELNGYIKRNLLSLVLPSLKNCSLEK